MRYLLAWTLYWMGDIVSKPMCRYEFLGGRLYPLYNKLMLASNDVQGDGGGPWEKPQSPQR